jgi:hypothetical protein
MAIRIGKEHRPALYVIAAQALALIAGAIFISVHHDATGTACYEAGAHLIASR